jgi:beta-galactosidase
MALLSASGDVGLELRVDRKEVRADTTDLAFVELRLVDGDGIVATAVDRAVTVEVDGPGELKGLASARPATEEPFTGSSCTTYDGRALAVVRPTGEGTITVRVAAEGGEAQELRIEGV